MSQGAGVRQDRGYNALQNVLGFLLVHESEIRSLRKPAINAGKG